MRVVIDTNVFISAALKVDSVPARAMIAAATRHVVIKSVDSEQELLTTINRPKLSGLIASAARASLESIIADAEEIDVRERISACRDPADDKFLELAVNGRADVIVSGDADLLAMNPFRGIPIETPLNFLRRVGP